MPDSEGNETPQEYVDRQKAIRQEQLNAAQKKIEAQQSKGTGKGGGTGRL